MENITYCDETLDKRIAELEEEFRSVKRARPRSPLSVMLKDFLESNMIGVARASIDGTFIDVNQAYLDLVGYERDDLLSGKVTVQDLTPDEFKYLNQTAIAQILTTGCANTFTKEYLRKDGHRVQVLVALTSLDNTGEDILCFAMNVSELQNARLEVKKREEQFRLLVDSIPQIVWVADETANIEYLNQRFIDYTGRELTEGLQLNWANVIHPDDMKNVFERWTHAVETASNFELELRHLTKDGSYHWVLCKSVPFNHKGEDVDRWIGTATDIDEHKTVLHELEDRECRFRMLADGIPQIVWTATADGKIDFFNHRWLEYMGLTIEQSLQGAWELLIHPEDLSQYLEQWSHAVRTGETYEHEFRLKRVLGLNKSKSRQNDYLWHLCRAVAFRNTAGRIVKWFGTWTEIHEQKK